MDGKEYDVELDELVKGYQRNADYTRKSQSDAQARKALEQQHSEAQQEMTAAHRA